MPTITLAATDAQIRRCFPVLIQLQRPLVEAEFVGRIRRQQKEGYRLVFLGDKKSVKAVAGYRLLESLAYGKYLYVDDLVTAEQFRSQGFGRRLFAWLIREAKARGCNELHLDSGVQRFDAHRFYLAHRMRITCHHFGLKLR